MLTPDAADQISPALEDRARAVAGYDQRPKMEYERAQRQMLEEVDPDARVQTGPGVPRWQWEQVALNWNGPVKRDQVIGLTLVSPAGNFALNLLRVALVAALTLLMLGFVYRRGRGIGRACAQLAALTFTLLLGVAPSDSRAEIPTPELLQELKARLLAPPECLPACAQIPRMSFELRSQSLTIRMQVHALKGSPCHCPRSRAVGCRPR